MIPLCRYTLILIKLYAYKMTSIRKPHNTQVIEWTTHLNYSRVQNVHALYTLTSHEN